MTTVTLDQKIQERELTQDFRDKFMVDLKGKDFITFDGLMVLGHAEGMTGIKTNIVQLPTEDNDHLAVIHATIKDKNGNEWTGTGDASPASVGKMIANALVRMAETRAIGRALRMMLGIGTMMEEVYNPYEPPAITDMQIDKIRKVMKKRGITKDAAGELCYHTFKKKAAGQLTVAEADAFIQLLQEMELDEAKGDA